MKNKNKKGGYVKSKPRTYIPHSYNEKGAIMLAYLRGEAHENKKEE